MKINRRRMLASSAALAGFSCLGGETRAAGAAKPAVPKDGVILTAMVKAKAGQEAAVKEILLALVKPTRQEAGCLCYNLHQSKADPTQFMFYEQWASQAALDAHMKMPYLTALGDKLKDKTEPGIGLVFYALVE